MVTNETLFKEYHLRLTGKINPDTTQKLERDIKKIPNFKEVSLLINTQGGALADVIKMNQMISDANIKFQGVGGSLVYSGGITLLLSCETQIAFRNTKFRHHRVCNPDGSFSNEYLDIEKELFNFIALRTGRTLKEVYDLADENQIISALEAKKFGFIKDVIDSDYTNEAFKVLLH